MQQESAAIKGKKIVLVFVLILPYYFCYYTHH